MKHGTNVDKPDEHVAGPLSNMSQLISITQISQASVVFLKDGVLHEDAEKGADYGVMSMPTYLLIFTIF